MYYLKSAQRSNAASEMCAGQPTIQIHEYPQFGRQEMPLLKGTIRSVGPSLSDVGECVDLSVLKVSPSSSASSVEFMSGRYLAYSI